MKGKVGLLTNFKWIKKCRSQQWKCCKKKFRVYAIFSFLKIVKIEPANKVQSFFSKRDAFTACKTPLFISFTSLIRME
jgi:hypothetical protein